MNKHFQYFKEIYQAIGKGVKVHWKSTSYEVTRGKNGLYYIRHFQGSCVGLYEPDYTPEDFYKII